MGGSVATTYRSKEGKVTKTVTYTGDVNDLFFTKEFKQDAGENALAEFTAYAEKMRDDYLKNKDTGNFTYELAGEFGSHGQVSPEGYGLIVVDFEKKHIASMQGYHCPGHESIFVLDRPDQMLRYLIENNLLDMVYFDKNDNQQVVSVQDFFGTKNLSEMVQMYRSIYDFNDSDPEFKKLAGIVDIETIDNKRGFYLTPIYRHGFSVKRYEENEQGYLDFYKDLLDSGFEISEEETEGWADHLYQREHYREEEFRNRKDTEEYQGMLEKFIEIGIAHV